MNRNFPGRGDGGEEGLLYKQHEERQGFVSKQLHRQEWKCPQFDLRISDILLHATKTYLQQPECHYISKLSMLQKHSQTLIKFCLLEIPQCSQ